jgi:hypothetical protein
MTSDEAFYDETIYEPESVSAQQLATQLNASLGLKSPEQVAEEKAEEAERIRDRALWANALPDPKDEERFWGNLGHRLVRGITRAQMDKMTIRDRVTAARQCFDVRQVLRDRPMTNINYDGRKTIMDAIPALTEELERRKRERATINVTPND